MTRYTFENMVQSIHFDGALYEVGFFANGGLHYISRSHRRVWRPGTRRPMGRKLNTVVALARAAAQAEG